MSEVSCVNRAIFFPLTWDSPQSPGKVVHGQDACEINESDEDWNFAIAFESC